MNDVSIHRGRHFCTDWQWRCCAVKPTGRLQRPVLIGERFWMSQCYLKSKDALGRGWTSPIPLLPQERTANMFWQETQSLPPHACSHRNAHAQTSAGHIQCTHALSKGELMHAPFTKLQPCHKQVNLIWPVRFSGFICSGTGTATIPWACIHAQALRYLDVSVSSPWVCGAG